MTKSKSEKWLAAKEKRFNSPDRVAKRAAWEARVAAAKRQGQSND